MYKHISYDLYLYVILYMSWIFMHICVCLYLCIFIYIHAWKIVYRVVEPDCQTQILIWNVIILYSTPLTFRKPSSNVSCILKDGLNGPSVRCRASRATRNTLLVISPKKREKIIMNQSKTNLRLLFANLPPIHHWNSMNPSICDLMERLHKLSNEASSQIRIFESRYNKTKCKVPLIIILSQFHATNFFK